MGLITRSWEPKDLLDDLRKMIDEEPDSCGNERRTVLCMARDYLKEYFTTLPNPPLTLEELKGIRREPVFIKYLKVDLPGEWKIIRFVSDREVGFTDGTSLYLPDSSQGTPCYGRTWLAYRRKPEEGVI